HVVNVPPHEGKVRLVMGFWTEQGRLLVDDPSAHDGRMRMLGPVIGEEAPLPEYHAVKASAPPVIDGELNDPVWQKAAPVILQGSLDGRPVRFRTEAKVAWDPQNLYVAFDCEDPDVWGTLKNHDDPIYNESVVEIFVDANADQKTYNE